MFFCNCGQASTPVRRLDEFSFYKAISDSGVEAMRVD